MDVLAEANSDGDDRGIQIFSLLKGKMRIPGECEVAMFYFYGTKKANSQMVHLK